MNDEVQYYYTLKQGDTLSKVAERFYGDPMLYPEIYDINRDVVGMNPDVVRPGMELKMPKALNFMLIGNHGLVQKFDMDPLVITPSPSGKKPDKKVLIAGGLVAVGLLLIFSVMR